MRWALKGRNVVTPEGERPAAVLVSGESIEAVLAPGELAAGVEIVDAGDRVVLPGLVDPHVHVNDPGRAEWEGFETATQAAAAGGTTSIVDMPLNSRPVTTTVAALAAKLRTAGGRLWADCGFWGGVIPGNAGELEGMVREGALGFKAFLIDSGIPEFPAAAERDLRLAMPILARLGVPLLVHAELETRARQTNGASSTYQDYLDSRPKTWENEAVRLMVHLCRETRCRVHIVHLSSAEALPLIRRAKEEGLSLTAETCPHYLVFAAEEIGEGRTEFKCAPPIRERENREKLWEGLKDGTIDFVASDHSPCAPELKRPESGDFMAAWGGIASLQLRLPAFWTEASRRGFSAAELSRLLSGAPARFAVLSAKGEIAPGRDADFVVWDPRAERVLEPRMIRHRHALTPYLGRRLLGEVRATFLRGRRIFDQGDLHGPFGKTLKRVGAGRPGAALHAPS